MSAIGDSCLSRVGFMVREVERRNLGLAINSEELVAEGLLGYVESLRSYRDDGGASPETYGQHRARGRIIESIRHQVRRKTVNCRMGENQQGEIPSESLSEWTGQPLERSIESRLTAREIPLILAQELTRLPYWQRYIVVEVGLKQRSLREVCRYQKFSRARATRLLEKGVERLRRSLQRQGYSLTDFA